MAEIETLARDAAVVLRDLRKLGRLLSIKTKSRGIIPFAFTSWHAEQRRFDRARTGRDVVLKARQIGFTTLELARDVQFARTHSGVQVLIVVHDSDIAEALFQAAHLMVSSLVDIGLAPRPKYSTKREIVFGDNHSAIRIVEAGETDKSAAKKGRSGTIHRLHATEVAFWGAAEETMTALLAAVPADGEVVVESTANGAGGLFYELVIASMAGRGGYRLHFYPWHSHDEYRAAVPDGFDPAPRDEDERHLREAGCDDEQIAFWRALIDNPARGGRERVLQEYPRDVVTAFRVSGGRYVRVDAIERLAARARDPIAVEDIAVTWPSGDRRTLGRLRVYERVRYGEQYVIGADLSEGIEGDGHSCVVLHKDTGRVVAAASSDSVQAGDWGLALAWTGRQYNEAVVAPERNNTGHAAIRAMLQEVTDVTPYERVWRAPDERHGWVTSSASRPPLFDQLRIAIESGVAECPDRECVSEASSLVLTDGRPAARGKGKKGGARDDLFVGWAIGWQIRSRVDDSDVNYAASGGRPVRQYEGQSAADRLRGRPQRGGGRPW